MSNRPAGGARSKRWPKEPLDWYCENATPVVQLIEAIPPPKDAIIYDPCCGRGNILDVFKNLGWQTVGSDLVERRDPCRHDQSLVSERHLWFKADVLKPARPVPFNAAGQVQVWCNPPYSYKKDICQRFIEAVLEWPVSRACFLVPIAFLNCETRYNFFTFKRPSQIAILCERPSCPPGSTLTPYTTFKGGMGDYCWLIYGPPHRWRTETIWLKPS